MTTVTEMPELSAKERRSRNWLVALFVALVFFATVVLVCGVLSRIYPDSGIPFIWIAFPVGPQAAPIP